ncbi:MAG: ABC transporter substrate-binding protein [Hyphomicrobiales bacterium]|nr:ABC transporter substrate-binding protein [Hyphomicrobiales bacterium]
MTRPTTLLAALAVALCAGSALAQQPPIRIGEISPYSALPQGTDGYRKGWQLALEQVNAAGGVLGGRKIEFVVRDSAGQPDAATRAAQELLTNEKVDLLAGTLLSHIGVAVADFANRNKVFFLASQPLTDAIIWEKGNRYTFRLRPSTYTQALIIAAEAAKLPAKRWATIAPNYEYGQSAVASFKAALKAKRPDVEFFAEQWPALGKLEAGATVQAMLGAKPDAIFNATFGADLARFVREGNLRGLFKDRPVVSLLSGEPEYLDPLKDEAPRGWTVTGYPWATIKTPAHVRFVEAYREKYKETPKMGSLMGYVSVQALAAIIGKAGSTETEKLIGAARDLTFDSAMGPITFRAIDQQSTMGTWVGKLDVKDGAGEMVDWRYVDGKDFQLDDAAVKARRPADAMR